MRKTVWQEYKLRKESKDMIRRFFHKKTNTHNEGSSLISVIIGVMFLAAIGIIILTVANKYITAVLVDEHSTDNFYESEGILAEVKTGLLEYAGDASEVAYTDIMENYSSATENMKETFAKEYISEIAAKLTGVSYTWDDSKLGTVQGADIEQVKKLTKVPEAVTTLPGTNLGYVINKETEKGYSITLKNLMIDYTNEADFRSTIQTDIKLTVPDYKFEGDSTLEELKNYIVISDDTLEVTTNTTSTGATFVGNIYTGNKDCGINIQTQNGAKFLSDIIISRGDFRIYTGANVDINGETGDSNLWLPNISLKPMGNDETSTLSTTLNVQANAYIENDLNIEDNNAVVSLGGKYYGYSYNQENTETTVTARSDYSSAILINGLNTTLNTDGLDKLILAGRTFVSRNDESGVSSVSDIMMGESLAVKSNQIAYLVPNEYIAAGHNPVFKDENQEIYEDALLASEMGTYLDSSEPYTANYNNSGGYVFFYLKFKDENSANEYFRHYYAGSSIDENGVEVTNKELMDERAKTYIATTDSTGMKLSPNLYLIAGNIIHNYYATGGSSLQADNYYDSTGKPKAELLADGNKIGQNYVGMQLSLLASESTGSMRLAEDAQALVADRIIDFSKVTGTISKTDSATGGRIHVVPGDYVVDGSITKGIIIAGGNVEVQSDFQGLILAKGKVTTVGGNRNLKYDMVLVGNLLEMAKQDEDLADIFYGMNGSLVKNPTNLSQCIYYQNWQKNTY